jgi:hypothetical protein
MGKWEHSTEWTENNSRGTEFKYCFQFLPCNPREIDYSRRVWPEAVLRRLYRAQGGRRPVRQDV